MRDFVNETELERRLQDLRDRGWLVVRSADSLELTDAGKRGHADALSHNFVVVIAELALEPADCRVLPRASDR